MPVDWATLIGGVLGGGAVGTVALEYVRRKIPTADTAAEREAKRIDARETALDLETARFQADIKKDLEQVRALHRECETSRKADNEACHAARMQDREEVAALRGQVVFLRESMQNMNPGGSHAKRKTNARPKTQDAKANGSARKHGG